VPQSGALSPLGVDISPAEAVSVLRQLGCSQETSTGRTIPGVTIRGKTVGPTEQIRGGVKDLRIKVSGAPTVNGVRLVDPNGNLPLEGVVALIIEVLKGMLEE
jgi:hypothetical protein